MLGVGGGSWQGRFRMRSSGWEGTGVVLLLGTEDEIWRGRVA